MAGTDRPSAHRRELGAELRRRREAVGISGLELAHQLGWSGSKISRLETGSRGRTEVDVIVYLAACNVPYDELNEILELAREPEDGYRIKPHADRLPDELRTLIFYESTAIELASFESVFVPGLTQTPEYARALFDETGVIPDDQMEMQVRARMARQELVKRLNPPLFTFYIHEHALRIMIGDPQIMHVQLLHLVFLTSRPQCLIRVIPASSRGQGLTNASFMFMRYTEHGPSVWVDTPTASLFLDGPADVAFYRRTLERLDRAALNEGESRQYLADLANEYDRMEDGHDEHA